MRAAFEIYEHPQLSDSEVWAKQPGGSRVYVYSVVGVLSIAASTLVVARYTALGKSWQASTFGRHWL
ncbi:hypothetical protein BD779DRAFT_1673415 [Infundibulicybe gibba]|nr:hypothetical protein BD779DRAFT_1673415 [Infundibulicybe gibba]